MAAYITVGAKTTHGGTVITGSPQTTHYGTPIARQGDKVVCKKCKKVVTIITGDPSYIVDGAPVARAGDMTSCGSKLIAMQQGFSESGFDVMGVEQPAQIGADGLPIQGSDWDLGFGNYNPHNPNEHWDPEQNEMIPGKPPIVIDSTKRAVYQYFNGNGEAVELGATTKSLLRNSERQKGALVNLKSGNTDMNGFYGVDMTSDMFHVGNTGIEYDTQCNNGMCTTTFKGFQQKDNTTGRVYPDAFDDPVDLGMEVVGGTPFAYKPYVWQETYPDNFTGKK